LVLRPPATSLCSIDDEQDHENWLSVARIGAGRQPPGQGIAIGWDGKTFASVLGTIAQRGSLAKYDAGVTE
jgi:hypothetical protein